MTRYYFDHAASAPRRDEVVEAMAPWSHGVVGNPSGSHRAAREARRAVEDAREEVASFVGARPGEVIFTGGGTESCHLGVVGPALARRRARGEAAVCVSRVEHHAVLGAAEWLERHAGVEVRWVDVDADGVVDLDALEACLDERCAVVSVMTANNETGVCQPIDAVSALGAAVAPGGVPLHTDAVAAAPWLHLPTVTASASLVSVCAHKIGGPVNAGALVVREGVAFDPVDPGGGQERGRRGGTVDVAAAVGLAAAARATARDLTAAHERASDLAARLAGALTLLPGARLTAAGAPRLPATVHLTFEGLASEELLFLIDQGGVCASAAASCSSGAQVASHVLAAMGMEPERARGSLRLSLGADTTESDVDAAVRVVADAVARLRAEAAGA